MPPQLRQFKGRIVESSSKPKPIKAHLVQASGSRNTVKITETSSSKRKGKETSAPLQVPDLQTLNQAIEEDWEKESPVLVTTSMNDDDAPSAPIAKLELMLDDAQENVIDPTYCGKL
ncbi:hypothetical protein FRC09_016330 [Ceratobasidium sp. 395]|nr:hypothetical protein FRC09_016330 [Ceratobasidium sp. 395]